MYNDTIGTLLITSYMLNRNNFYRVKAGKQKFLKKYNTVDPKSVDTWLEANNKLSGFILKTYSDWENSTVDLYQDGRELSYHQVLGDLQSRIFSSVNFAEDTDEVPGEVRGLFIDSFEQATKRLNQFLAYLQEDVDDYNSTHKNVYGDEEE